MAWRVAVKTASQRCCQVCALTIAAAAAAIRRPKTYARLNDAGQPLCIQVAPGLVEGACKLACFERRCGDKDAAVAAYCSLLPPPLGGFDGTDGWQETTETTRQKQSDMSRRQLPEFCHLYLCT